jgi:hypothetical protein
MMLSLTWVCGAVALHFGEMDADSSKGASSKGHSASDR